MARTRQQNVTAAQWSANGAALGAPDLTEPGSYGFGANVFSAEVQRARLPKEVFRRLQSTLERGEALDPSLADAVAKEMREWAMERGATHYTHWFQPLTGLTAEKHDSFYAPDGDGSAIAEFSGKELIQGEPDASSFPTGGIRATFEARGYTAWDPSSPAFILENPNGALLCIPTAFASWTGEALDQKIPLLRSMDALSRSAVHALGLLGDTEAKRVFTTVGPEQEYFLIDEQYYFERPDLYTTGRTLFGAKPPKGHELDEHYFGSIPERILACMMETEGELAAPRRAGQDPPQRGRAQPVRDRADLRELQRRHRPPAAHDAGHAERGPALRAGLPAAREAVRRRQRLGQAQQLVDGHRHGRQPARAGRHAAREHPVPVLLQRRSSRAVNKHQALLRASVANVGQDHRLGANEAPPAIISIFLGAELEKVFATIEAGEGDPATPGSFLELGTPVLPPLPMHGGDRNRTSPFAFTGNKFEFRALGSSMSLALAEHGAQHDRGRGDRRAGGRARAARRRRDERRRGGRAGRARGLRGQQADRASTATTTPRRGTPRPSGAGWPTCARRPTRCRGSSRSQTIRAFERYEVLSRARARVPLRGARRAVRDEAQHRGRDRSVDRAHDDPARHGAPPGRAKAAGNDELISETAGPARRAGPRIVKRLEELNAHEGSLDSLEHARCMRDNDHPGDGRHPRGGRPAGARRRRRPVAAAEVLGDAVHQVAPLEDRRGLRAALEARPS